MNISIKSARIAIGMTQAELAKALGVDQSAVSLWESGNSFPRSSRLMQIKDVLNCTLDELMKENE